MLATTPNFRLYKREKLCSNRAIESLFARPESTDAQAGLNSVLAYPLRAVWRRPDPSTEPRIAPLPQFVVTVPKRRLRHAVDRVRIRRLVREAWRLNRPNIPQGPLHIAFIYVGQGTSSYRRIERALLKILSSIH